MFCYWKLYARAHAVLPRHFERVAGCKLRCVAEFQNLPPVSPISKLFRYDAEFQNLPQGLQSQIVLLLPDFFPVHQRYFGNITRSWSPLAKFLVRIL